MTPNQIRRESRHREKNRVGDGIAQALLGTWFPCGRMKTGSGTVFRVCSGNFLEMYDFMIFGYFSAAIGRAYFPARSEFASLMFSMTTFAVGFMIRPLGAIFLGAYIDHMGRRKGLLVTLALMSVGTVTIAMVPGYETIGLFAPVVVVLGVLHHPDPWHGGRGLE